MNFTSSGRRGPLKHRLETGSDDGRFHQRHACQLRRHHQHQWRWPPRHCRHTGIIYNEDGAFISGHKGVVLNGGDVTLNNNGKIVGSGTPGNCGIYISSTAIDDQIYNNGSIIGQDKGIQIRSIFEGNSITNHGVVGGGKIGIDYSMPAGLYLEVDNVGKIKGGTAAITANSRSLNLDNQGIVIGNVLLE